MSDSFNEYIRFECIKKENGKVLYYDKNNSCVPFIVVETKNMESYIKPIRTTRDLVAVKAVLFSKEKEALNYIKNNEGDQKNGKG